MNELEAQNNIATQFGEAIKGAKESLSENLEQIERLVVAPTLDYLILLDQVKKTIVKRSHKLLDYDRHRSSVEKLRQKTNRTAADEKTLGQYENNLDQATREYNNINNILKQELPIFLALRVDFIDPCLLTFYNYQVKVFHTLYGIFYQVANNHFDLSTSAKVGYELKADAINRLLTSLNVPKRFNSQKEAANPEVARVPTTNGSGQNSRTNSNEQLRPRAPVPIPVSQSKYVVALYDYDAQAAGDLSFKRNDKIELVERKSDANDWWTGRFNGKVGQFPGQFY